MNGPQATRAAVAPVPDQLPSGASVRGVREVGKTEQKDIVCYPQTKD